MKDFDLKKYLAENKLVKEILQKGDVSPEEMVAANQFQIDPIPPVKVTKVIGDITPLETNIDLHMSNGDFITYYFKPDMVAEDSYAIQLDGESGEYQWSNESFLLYDTGTIIGTMLEIYKRFKEGKITNKSTG
tara:strand:- start:434 stop:832 length:399 start_codon:yes stop_codon:yes gene_type:complete